MIYQDEHTCFHIADEFVGIDCDETKDYDYREWSWNGGFNCVLMQFTGLKDKNGKEIYEGDVMKVNIGGYEEIGTIEYVEEKAGFFWKHLKNDTYYALDILNKFKPFEIIGNKYV